MAHRSNSPPRRSRRLALALRVVFAALLLGASFGSGACAGCLGSPPKNEYFYFLSGPTAVVEKKGKGPTLAIASFTSSPGYDSRQMAYRTGANELRYYGYRRWLAEPASMVRDMTVRHFRASGHFGSVVASSSSSSDVDAMLFGRVVAIEEVDKPNDQWFARLAMVFVLQDEKSSRVLLRHAFDVTRPCTRRHPTEVARLVSKILAQQLDTLMRKIGNALGGGHSAAVHTDPAARARHDAARRAAAAAKRRAAARAAARARAKKAEDERRRRNAAAAKRAAQVGDPGPDGMPPPDPPKKKREKRKRRKKK